MPEFEPTDAQRRAIEATGSSILVSAGAGSGKTAVLARRCAHLAAEARPACRMDQLLVVTFTEAAASEMRERIGEALRGRLHASPTNAWLQRQSALLDTASISTIHSFCRQTLNRYFAQADLEPQAAVMDADEAALLRHETAREVFDRFADRRGKAGEAFLDLLSAYGGGSEQGLIRRALTVDAFLTAHPDPQRWLDEAAARFEIPQEGRLPEIWARLLTDTLRTELADQAASVQTELTGLTEEPQVVAGFATCLETYLDALKAWGDRLAGDPHGLSATDNCLADIGGYAFPALPRLTPTVKKQGEAVVSAFESAQERVKRVRELLYKKRLLDAFGRFTTADWAEGVARTRGHVRTFLSVVSAIRKAYQEAKRDLGTVDFADLERKTLDLLQDEPNGVAARLRNRYEHVLVDEFQDVNPVQAEILRRISREGEPGRAGNLFAVGDVKQSIYRFRLAEPRLFLDRRASFDEKGENADAPPRETSGRVIDLVENFRSRPRVIDAVNAVFERLMARDLGGIDYDEHARLKPGLTDAKDLGGPALELHVLDDPSGDTADDESPAGAAGAFDWERIEREAYVVAQRVKDLAATGTPYGDMVILLRSMKPRAGLFVRTLSHLGVPVFADASGGFFDAMEVLDLLSLLELLDNEQQDIPMAAVLRSRLFGPPLTDDELVEIRTATGGRRGDVPFHAAVRAYARGGPEGPLRDRLTAMQDRLRRWRQRARRRPLADVLWDIYEESGHLAYVTGRRDGPQRRANLIRLHEYARQFGTFTRQGLHRFLTFIHGLQDAGEDLDAGSVVSPSDDVVRVMTIHRSKGLEFPVVILGELGKQFNLSDARGAILFDRRLGIAMEAVDVARRITYPTLPHRLVSRAATSESLAEELRVLYVAMTRAKDRLILVGTRTLAGLEQDRRRYAGHEGVVPVIDRRSARTMLDWVSAAICCQSPNRVSFEGLAEGEPTPPKTPLFHVQAYDANQMERWTIEPPPRTDVAERLKRCARLEEARFLPADGALPGAVETVARRLTTPYPAAAMTRVPAVVAASVLKRRWDARQDEADPTPSWTGDAARRPPVSVGRHLFREPVFSQRKGPADPTRRGTWTHEFLQRLDLSRPCDAADLRTQLSDIVSAGAMRSDEAAGVDIGDVAWFFATPLGARLRAGQTRVLREWPFVMGADPAKYDPSAAGRDEQDVMLVRGIIDCLFDDGTGWEIVDYKTDAVNRNELEARAAEYRGQLRIYAAAAESIWQCTIPHCWLAFLSARQIVEV